MEGRERDGEGEGGGGIFLLSIFEVEKQIKKFSLSKIHENLRWLYNCDDSYQYYYLIVHPYANNQTNKLISIVL